MSANIFALADTTAAREFPLFLCPVKAGFPSPADDFIEATLDLNKRLVPHPSATFFLKVKGDSMINAGIYENDLLIVDASLEARHGSVIIAALNGELTVKRLFRKAGLIKLLPENDRYPAIPVEEWMDFSVWGVVRHVIHNV